MGRFADRLAHAWNAFTNRSPDLEGGPFSTLEQAGSFNSGRPDRVRFRVTNERSIIASIYTRISIDFASVLMRHVRVDESGRYLEDVDSGLNNCLSLEANIDQNARSFNQDAAMTLLEKGVIAIVPVDTSISPELSGGYDIQTMRVGTIVKWYPRHLRVNLYNDRTGRREEVTLSKSSVAVIENPLYSVMNEPNSTLQRLTRKLSLLDVVDEQSSSGKLDLIVQLPYVIKSDSRRAQAEQRRQDIEFQLKGSQYGIAYTDGTEKITQLNRPAENNLLKQVEYLTAMLYGQLGLTEEVMNGTADEKAMLNYHSRTLEPILDSFVQEYKRKFLTKTARTQKQSIEYFRDPFKLVPIDKLGEVANQLSRNEIATANELRPFFGFKPSKDPKADKLVNSNVNPNSPAPSGQVTSDGNNN